MKEKNRKKLWNRIHRHTVLAMIDCADHGHGCDTRRAIRSAGRLMDLVEKIIKDETNT